MTYESKPHQFLLPAAVRCKQMHQMDHLASLMEHIPNTDRAALADKNSAFEALAAEPRRFSTICAKGGGTTSHFQASHGTKVPTCHRASLNGAQRASEKTLVPFVRV